jgi:hypothetical protein
MGGHLKRNLALQSTHPEVKTFCASLSRQRAAAVPSCSTRLLIWSCANQNVIEPMGVFIPSVQCLQGNIILLPSDRSTMQVKATILLHVVRLFVRKTQVCFSVLIPYFLHCLKVDTTCKTDHCLNPLKCQPHVKN